MGSLAWRCGIGAICAVMAAVLVLAGVQTWHHIHPPNGPSGDPDPGGRILAVLTTAEAAVPTDADVLLRQVDGPRWDSCDGRDGTFGWSDAVVVARFASDEDPQTVLSRADALLRTAGWTAGNLVAGADGAWTRRIDAETVGNARLDREGQGTTWDLYASAPPHGQRVSGC